MAIVVSVSALLQRDVTILAINVLKKYEKTLKK